MNYIKLGNLDSSLISGIKQIVKTRDYLYIAEYKSVWQFDTLGHFMRQIGSFGKGPGEYLSVTKFAATDEKIVIAEYRRFLIFAPNGQFIESIPFTGGTTEYITFINDHLWVFVKRDYHKNEKNISGKFYIYSEDFQVIDSVLNYQISNEWGAIAMGFQTNYLSVLRQGTYIYLPVITPEPFLRDTLYRLEGDKLVPVFKLDFSQILKTNQDVIIDVKTMSVEETIAAEIKIRSVTISDVYRTNNFIFAEYFNHGKPFFFCFNLKTQKGYNMSDGFTDDLFGTEKVVRLIPLNLDAGEFCFVKNGYEVEGLIDGIDENSNPVVFFLKTKEDS